MYTETALSRREATLRSAATICLIGIALVQATELPPLFAQGSQLGVLSLVATALSVGLIWKLASAPAEATSRLWHVVAAFAAVVLAGWGAGHALGIPGLAADKGNWGSIAGLICAALAVGCLGLAAVAAPPRRATVRGVATALVVALAVTPPAAIALVAFGPGTTGGQSVLASDGGHIHSHGSPEGAIVYQPLPGGKGGHYVYKAKTIPHQTTVTLGLIVSAAFVFTYGAVVYLRRRTAQGEPLGLGMEGKLA